MATSKRFAAKFFISSGSQEPTELSDVPNMLEQATKLHKSSLKSAARGGAKTAEDAVAAHMIELSAFHNSVLGKLFLTLHLFPSIC